MEEKFPNQIGQIKSIDQPRDYIRRKALDELWIAHSPNSPTEQLALILFDVADECRRRGMSLIEFKETLLDPRVQATIANKWEASKA
jgi:hypothetical protein